MSRKHCKGNEMYIFEGQPRFIINIKEMRMACFNGCQCALHAIAVQNNQSRV